MEPPSNLVATQVSSKSVRITWDPSTSQITGYRLQFIPMIAGGKQHVLSVGPQTTALNVKDLSPDTEYQINVYAMKGLTPSEPITIMEKTQPVKVQVGEFGTTLFSNCSSSLMKLLMLVLISYLYYFRETALLSIAYFVYKHCV